MGKTTFVNYHRQRWEIGAKHKLISPVGEISVREGWGERDFLLSLLASLSARLRLDMGEKEFEKDKLMREITTVTGVRIEEGGGFNASISVFGTGAGLGRTSTSSVKVGELTNDHLRDYLSRLIAHVRKQGFAGAIFHLNNLELLARQSPEALSNFFDAVRDVLQEPGVYFIFVGYSGMFQQVIVPLSRVRSIFFDTPVHLDPLSAVEVHAVIGKRYHLLGVPGKQWIKPVVDEVIGHLYEIFSGRIRYIMNAVTSLISHLPDSFAQPLTLAEASNMLRTIALSELRPLVHGAEGELFLAAAEMGRFTNSALVGRTGKSKQLIQKYLKNWLRLNLVAQGQKQGRNQFYEVESRFAVLKAAEPARSPAQKGSGKDSL